MVGHSAVITVSVYSHVLWVRTRCLYRTRKWYPSFRPRLGLEVELLVLALKGDVQWTHSVFCVRVGKVGIG